MELSKQFLREVLGNYLEATFSKVLPEIIKEAVKNSDLLLGQDFISVEEAVRRYNLCRKTFYNYHNKRYITLPALELDETTVLVLKNVGLKGYPGMPEVGNMALPKKMLAKGIKDMVRISDGRMSGTGFGTVVLHVSPEAALGGNFSVIETGDTIELDVAGRRLNVLLTKAELNRRKKKWKAEKQLSKRGYVSLYLNQC